VVTSATYSQKQSSLLLLVACLALLTSCQQADRDSGTQQPATATMAPGAAVLPACEPDGRACLDARTARHCQADGRGYREQHCGKAESCLGGSCVSLRLASHETRLDRLDLLVPRGAGWLNAWASQGPYYARALRRIVEPTSRAFDHELAKGFRPRCRPTGMVSVHRRRYGKRKAGTRYHLLLGYAVVGRTQQAILKLGAQGHVRVWLGDELVADVDRTGSSSPLPDEVLRPITLSPGATPIAVAVGQKRGDPTGYWLRIHDRAGRVPPDLRWALAHGLSGACDLATLSRGKLHPAAVQDGFTVQAELGLLGLAPERARGLDYRITLGRGKRKEVLSRGRVGLDALLSNAPVPSTNVRLTKRRNTTLSLELSAAPGGLTDANAVTAVRRPLRYQPKRHARIVALANLAASLPDSIDADSRDSFQHAIDTLMGALATGHTDHSWLRKRTRRLEGLAESLSAGTDPYLKATGVLYRAYRSKLDGRLQPYVIYVPPSHARNKRRYPLIVVSHGLGQKPALALRTVFGMGPEEDEDRSWATRHLPPLPDLGAIVVAPWGYDGAGWRQLGEHDVLEVIARTQRHYRVDAARVSLTGYSLGGTVAFVVPLHYPDRFAAAAPLCGYPNLTTYESVRKRPKRPWEEQMLAKRFIGNYAFNGLHLPMNIVHGGQDGPHRSAIMAKRYRKLGYRRIFDLQDELGHNVWDHAYENGRMIAWLRQQRRPQQPDRARLRTGSYRYHRAFWIRLIAMSDQGKGLATIDASYQRSRGALTISTERVDAFAVSLNALGATGKSAPSTLAIDGRETGLSANLTVGRDQELVFVRNSDGFAQKPSVPDRRGRKRPSLSGPLDDVLRRPLLIIWGNRDPSQRETNRMVAEHHASHDHWAGAQLPAMADDQIDESLLRGRSLVLVGNPESNRVTARLAERLGVRFDDNGLLFRDKRHDGQDVGISVIRPHPLDEEHYVVLHAGVGPAGTLASRHLPRMAPDFLVYDSRITVEQGGELLGSRQVLDGGFFSDSWK